MELVSESITNCDTKSVIKILPKSWLKITKNCELVGNICHNTTSIEKPLIMSSIALAGSVQLFNFTNVIDCKNLKKIKNQEILKSVSRANGVRDCDDTRIGVRCYNGTLMKYKSSVRLLQMISHIVGRGDRVDAVDNIAYENGKKSCVKVAFVVSTD